MISLVQPVIRDATLENGCTQRSWCTSRFIALISSWSKACHLPRLLQIQVSTRATMDLQLEDNRLSFRNHDALKEFVEIVERETKKWVGVQRLPLNYYAL